MRRPLQLVVDARMLNHAGVGTYLRNLVPRVAELLADCRVTALVPSDTPADALPGAELVPASTDIYTVAEQLELVKLTPRGARLFWSPHYNIPLFTRAPLVVTVHDVAHLARSERGGVIGAARRAYARVLFSAVRRRARAVLFVSDFTRREFSRLVGEPRDAAVVHNGVDESWFSAESPSRRGAGSPYLLFIGSVKPHKNLAALINVFLQLDIPHELVIIGASSGLRAADSAALQAAQSNPRIRLLGRVDDSSLRRYVAGASALVFPSIYEGFGLPPLEAMAAGTPCVVSNIPAVAEVCADAALYFDPMNASDMAAQIRRLLQNESVRYELIIKGRARAREFSWDHAAERTAEVLARAAFPALYSAFPAAISAR